MNNQINPDFSNPKQSIDYLNQPSTIRLHCKQVMDHVARGDSEYLCYHPEVLEDAANFVANLIKKNYPDLDVPLHSRMRHFEVGGKNRLALLNIEGEEHAKRIIELVIISVFLDAGSGGYWKYRDCFGEGEVYYRSEGLAVATFEAYSSGFFSADPKNDPYRVDGMVLKNLDLEKLKEMFQVSPDNKLEGIEGRWNLLNKMGTILEDSSDFTGDRLGDFYDVLIKNTEQNNKKISSQAILKSVLLTFSNIWPGSMSIGGVSLGDVSVHPIVKGSHGTDRLVPFHKLSQWLTYSLFEAMTLSGYKILDENNLTALAEYRNGGFLVDMGVITVKQDSLVTEALNPRSIPVVEWRALTISLIDELAVIVRDKLSLDEASLSLGKLLQGGTWTAGRVLANQLRSGGSPPIKIKSDGTLF